jgi:hypothetical protein
LLVYLLYTSGFNFELISYFNNNCSNMVHIINFNNFQQVSQVIDNRFHKPTYESGSSFIVPDVGGCDWQMKSYLLTNGLLLTVSYMKFNWCLFLLLKIIRSIIQCRCNRDASINKIPPQNEFCNINSLWWREEIK